MLAVMVTRGCVSVVEVLTVRLCLDREVGSSITFYCLGDDHD